MSTTLYGKDDLTGQLTECNTLNAANVPLIVTEFIDSADGTGAGTGTTLALTAGQGGATGGGGAIFITSGDGGAFSGAGSSGVILITSGDGGAISGNSGNIEIFSGAAPSGTRGTLILGDSGSNVDFPSGTLVDFTGATVTGLAGTTLSGTLIAGNTTGANNIIIDSGQAVEGDTELHLTASGDVFVTTASSQSIFIGSDQGAQTSDQDDLHLDAGNDIFLGNSRGGDVTIGIPGGGNDVTINNFSSPSGTLGNITANGNSSSTGDQGNGLILIDRGGTKVLNTGGFLTLGPVFYDPNNGQRIRFGASIQIDGDGVTNTINGDDATQHRDEALTKLTSDGTQDLAIVGPVTANNLTPSSVTLRGFLTSAPSVQVSVTDDGVGGFPVSSLLPAGGTIVYATGVLTGVTASLVDTSEVVALYLVDNTAGEALTPRGGAGSGTAAGGLLNLIGGAGGATGIGGGVSITSGAGGSTSGDSGAINIVPGTVVSGTRGVITIGASGTVTDFPSGSMVDFAGATVTGLAGGDVETVQTEANTGTSLSTTWTIPAGKLAADGDYCKFFGSGRSAGGGGGSVQLIVAGTTVKNVSSAVSQDAAFHVLLTRTSNTQIQLTYMLITETATGTATATVSATNLTTTPETIIISTSPSGSNYNGVLLYGPDA